jgi:peroxiredoxin Q/BCP
MIIDVLKATKGRRMSKKTRKKSSKSTPKKAARSASKTAAKTNAKKSSAKKVVARKTPAARKTAAPKAAKAKAAKAKAVKGGRTTPAPARAVTAPKAKPPAAKSTVRPAAKAAAKPAAVAPAARVATNAEHNAIRGTQVLVEGSKVPAFKLPRDGGAQVSLVPDAGRKLVVFFYPRADTPGCTKEAMDFSRLASAFAAERTDVVGVSADPLKAQEAFRDKHELKVPLLSDEPHDILEAFGVWGEKSMYGRTFHGVLRTTVAIGSDRKVARIWRSVKVDGHADEVLEYIKTL